MKIYHNGGCLSPKSPKTKKIMKTTIKIKKRNLEIVAAATAIPVNPNKAATIEIIKKTIAQ